MIIQDNIIKEYLKNVYFICGNACGGKTTLTKMLAEKHGFYLYDMDENYHRHRRMAEPAYQPNMCYHLQDFHTQYTRPTARQALWNIDTLAESTHMALMDLVALSQDKKVVADVSFSPVYTDKTVDYNHFVFLSVDKSEIRKSYFNRPEKQGFYNYVKEQELADTYFENIFRNLELTNRLENRLIEKSGLYILKRERADSREDILAKVEKHFGLV